MSNSETSVSKQGVETKHARAPTSLFHAARVQCLLAISGLLFCLNRWSRDGRRHWASISVLDISLDWNWSSFTSSQSLDCQFRYNGNSDSRDCKGVLLNTGGREGEAQNRGKHTTQPLPIHSQTPYHITYISLKSNQLGKELRYGVHAQIFCTHSGRPYHSTKYHQEKWLSGYSYQFIWLARHTRATSYKVLQATKKISAIFW